ncbi:T9SS type A sorting domain-containing protein [Flavobacterium sp. RHBU_24]|uniref:T9SS type A sorting domain-containing protein n=1 Tax=Flavobacterium sp. RHBU_24 TaxID=3391185 RepID=UPI00398496AB
MKKILLSGIITLSAIFSATAQIVNIPDPVFKNFLVNHSYHNNPGGSGINIPLDINQDGEIQVSEAATYPSNGYNHGFILSGLDISDLTGIEAFDSIEYLSVDSALLTTINVNGCQSLKRLRSSNNSFTAVNISNPSLEILELTNSATLTSVNVSGCPGMKNINCSNNSLITSVNVNGCEILEELRLNMNPMLTTVSMGYHGQLSFFQSIDCEITSLDFSGCPTLEWALFTNNNLTSLNLANGNPQSFEHIMATGNPGLTCIKVDNVVVSEFLWGGGFYEFDEWANFSLDCTPASPCVVNIPDANFKTWLINNTAINTNGNAQIECEEATAYTGAINVDNIDISDMMGIEAFVNITALSCNNLNIWNFSTLNVSGFTALTTLSCTGNNHFSDLDVSGCTALTTFTVDTGNSGGTDLHIDASGCTALTGFAFPAYSNNYLSLSGCTALTALELDAKNLYALDITNCSALTSLVCSNNHLEALSLTGCSALTTLNCAVNEITALTVSNLPLLTNLNCGNNELVSLNVLDNPALNVITCFENHLPYLITSNNPGLTQLDCSHNNITYLDVSNNLNLAALNCSYNNISLQNVNANIALISFNCAHNNISTQNVSLNTALTSFFCDYNNLTAIDVSNNTALKYFGCSHNQLPALNLGSCPALLQLDCSYNLLTALNTGSNPSLSGLACTNNQLTGLNLNSNHALVLLDCSHNSLTGLSVLACPNLYQMVCSHNQLTMLNVSNTHCILLMCDNNQLIGLNLANGYNTSAIQVTANNNPALECVQVDDVAFSNENWAAPDFVFDNGVNFTEDCYALSLGEITANVPFSLYPNPTKDVVHFSAPMDAQLYSVTGQLLANIKNASMLDLSGQAAGIYFILLTNESGQVVHRSKIVKE